MRFRNHFDRGFGHRPRPGFFLTLTTCYAINCAFFKRSARQRGHSMKALFSAFADHIALPVGTPWAVLGALAVVAVWGMTGPLSGFSETWQLVINSFTTIVTFLMVFIIQNTQNRDFRALQLKLDALLQASDEVHPGLVNLHNLSEDDSERLEQAFQRSAGRHGVDEVVRFLESPSDSENKAK